MKAPWEKFSLPAGGTPCASGSSAEFIRTMRAVFGPLVERVTEFPAGKHAWLMAEVPSEGSLSLFFRDLGHGQVKVSFRSTGSVDVNAFAHKFGGGGHARAAGAMIPGKLEAVRDRVVEAAREFVSNDRPA